MLLLLLLLDIHEQIHPVKYRYECESVLTPEQYYCTLHGIRHYVECSVQPHHHVDSHGFQLRSHSVLCLYVFRLSGQELPSRICIFTYPCESPIFEAIPYRNMPLVVPRMSPVTDHIHYPGPCTSSMYRLQA